MNPTAMMLAALPVITVDDSMLMPNRFNKNTERPKLLVWLSVDP